MKRDRANRPAPAFPIHVSYMVASIPPLPEFPFGPPGYAQYTLLEIEYDSDFLYVHWAAFTGGDWLMLTRKSLLAHKSPQIFDRVEHDAPDAALAQELSWARYGLCENACR